MASKTQPFFQKAVFRKAAAGPRSKDQSPALCEMMLHITCRGMVPPRAPTSPTPGHWHIGRGLLDTSAWLFIIQLSFLLIAGTHHLTVLPKGGNGKAGGASYRHPWRALLIPIYGTHGGLLQGKWMRKGLVWGQSSTRFSARAPFGCLGS